MRKAALFFLVACPTLLFGQVVGGNSLAVLAPSGDFAETHTVGVGFYGNIEVPISRLALVGELGWAQWSADEDNPQPESDWGTWSILGGVKLKVLGPLYVEGRAGYYFKELNEFAVIPAVGLRLWKFDLNLGANLLDPTPFLNARLGFYWAGTE